MIHILRGKSKKLHHPWTGPYRVVSKLSECDYKIKLPRSKKAPVVVHLNRLKLCSSSTRFYKSSKAAEDSYHRSSCSTTGWS